MPSLAAWSAVPQLTFSCAAWSETLTQMDAAIELLESRPVFFKRLTQ